MADAARETSDSNEPIVIAPTTDHSGTVIFVHGMGQMSSSWVPVLRPVVERLPGAKWVLPQAPNAPVTYSNERIRPSWFNIANLPPCNCYDEPGVSASIAKLEENITAEVRGGISPSKIVLVGFSQGAALSLMTALSTLHELGGVASLSGWIPQQSRQAMEQMEPVLPVFWSHGTADEEVPQSYGDECVSFLLNTLNIPAEKVEFRLYDGLEHTVDDRVLTDLAKWLEGILA